MCQYLVSILFGCFDFWFLSYVILYLMNDEPSHEDHNNRILTILLENKLFLTLQTTIDHETMASLNFGKSSLKQF